MRFNPSLQLFWAMADAFGNVSSEALDAAWSRWIGPERFNHKLVRFQRRGWTEGLDKTKLSRVVHLTETGRLAALGGRDPVAGWRRPWDGRWRLVVFDIPEQRLALRARLRRKLCELGFGYLQRSVWIRPDSAEDIRKLMSGAEVDVESFVVLEARPAAGETDEQIVNGSWNFDRINANYLAYLAVLDAVPRILCGKLDRLAWFEVESKAWRQAVQNDPFLPDVLLPHGYRGRDAWRLRTEVLGKILREF